MKPRDLSNLLNRAATALETPQDLTPKEREELIADLCDTADTYDHDPKDPSLLIHILAPKRG